MLQDHVFLEVAYNSRDHRRAFLGVGIVDQVVCDQKAERVRETGHGVYCLEENIQQLWCIRT